MLKFSDGEVLQWRFPDGKVFHYAEFGMQNEQVLELKFIDKPSRIPVKGREIVLRVDINDFHTEVLESSDGYTLRVRPIVGDQRRYFRVDDYFPVTAKKLEEEKAEHSRSRVIPVFGFESSEIAMPDLKDGNQLRIWRALHGINNKMSIIAYYLEVTQNPVPDKIEKVNQVLKLMEQADFRLASVMDELGISKYRLARAENKRVNLSAAGVRFVTHEPLMMGDFVELKMLLPTTPPTGIMARSRVVRSEDLGKGRYDVALDFSGMDDSVQDLIINYALDRQRDIVKRKRAGSEA